jgi:tRNA A-37 threonylcarbamoyl transferase component Bud32
LDQLATTSIKQANQPTIENKKTKNTINTENKEKKIPVVKEVGREAVAEHAVGLGHARRGDLALDVVVIERLVDDVPLVDVGPGPGDDV